MTSEGIKAERRDSHRLDVLRDLLPDENPFKDRFRPLTFLTIYATYRYPKDAGRMPARAEKDDLDFAMKAVGEILAEVAAHFGVTLADSDKVPAAVSTAPRN